MEKIKPYRAELGAALAFIIYWLLSSFVPTLEPLKESFLAILVIVFGLIFGVQVKKGLLGAGRTAMLKVDDYWAEIITMIIGAAVSVLVQLVPDLVPYQADIVSIVAALVFALLEVGLGYRKGKLLQ